MIPTLSDLKAYGRIEHTAEDALLSALIARATSTLEMLCDLPVQADALTWTDDPLNNSDPGPRPSTRYARALVLPHRGVTVTAIVDGTGATVATADYRVDPFSGLIYAQNETRWVNGPYTISYTAGMDLLPNATSLAPAITAAILDIAMDYYQRRTPGAASESAAQSSISWDVSRDVLLRVEPLVRRVKLTAMA